MPQKWNPKAYKDSADFVQSLGSPLVDILAPKLNERILDLGCGNGELTQQIAASGAEVIGGDASPDFVAATMQRGVQARVIDGQALDYTDEFDAVFSNAALHWMPNANAVIKGVADALVNGGRFVAEFGAKNNVRCVRQALHETLRKRSIDPAPLDPWYFPGEEYQQLLEAHGFKVEAFEIFDRPTELPGDIADWVELFGGCFLDALDDDRDKAIDEIRELVRPELLGEDGIWRADYVRLRFVAKLNR